MNCKVHPSRNGVNTCSKCGEWLCEDCSVEVNGRVICKGCIDRLVNTTATGGSEPSGSGYRVERPTKRHISWGLLFLFSFCMPPGTNYMYMGLIKRGLFMISAFFLSIYFTVALGIAPILGFIIPVLYITCIFDAFQIRRKLNAGEYVEDSVRDVTGFLKRYKWVVVAILLFFMSSSWVSVNTASVYYGFGFPWLAILFSRLMSFVPVVIIGFGIYSIMKSRKSSSRKSTARRSDNEQ